MTELQDKEITYKGYWWDPQTPEEQWYGELTLTRHQYPVLEVYTPPIVKFKEPSKYDLVVGGGPQAFSLFDLEYIGSYTSNYGNGGFKSRRFQVRGPVMRGAALPPIDLHIKSLRLQIFNRSNVLVDTSRRWRPQHRIKKSSGERDRKFDYLESPIRYRDDAFAVRFGLSFRRRNSRTETTYQFKPIFSIISSEPHLFKDYKEIALRFQRYLSLIAGELVYFEEYKAQFVENLSPITLHNLGDLPSSRPWLWKHDFVRYRVSIIFEKAPNTISSWFHQYDSLEPVINLFFYTLEYGFDEESEYTVLCQSLEGFHRVVYKGNAMDPDVYKRDWRPTIENFVRTTFKGKANSRGRKAVYGSLYRAYQLTLEDRVCELLRSIENLRVAHHVIGHRKIEDVAKRIAESRNILAHRDDPEDMKSVRDQLPSLIKQVRFLLGLCMLRQIGFSQKDIEKWFS